MTTVNTRFILLITFVNNVVVPLSKEKEMQNDDGYIITNAINNLANEINKLTQEIIKLNERLEDTCTKSLSQGRDH